MSGKDFLEVVAAVCKRPKIYTPIGSFYEVVSFLEGYASGNNIGDESYHMPFTPFRKWLVGKFDSQKTILDWADFREMFSSELEALENLPILYEMFINSDK